MPKQKVPPGRKARRAGVKAIVERLNFCIHSRPPLNFEAAEMCYKIYLTATVHSYPLFIALLGWRKARRTSLAMTPRSRFHAAVLFPPINSAPAVFA